MLNFLFNGSNKFKNNFDSYPDAIVIINKFGDIVYSNKLFHSVFALNETYQPVNNINDLLDKFVLPLNDVNTVFPLTGVVKYTLNNDFAYLEYSVNKEEKNDKKTSRKEYRVFKITRSMGQNRNKTKVATRSLNKKSMCYRTLKLF